MKTKKMSLANIQGKLSRAEMKNIMAGLGDPFGCPTTFTSSCSSGNNCRCCWGSGNDQYCTSAKNTCPK